MSKLSIATQFLRFIPLKNSLKKHVLFFQTLEKVAEKLTADIPEIQQLRLNPDLTLLVCVVVEEIVPTKSEIDKKLLVVQILDKIFTLTEDEKAVVESQIQHSYDEGAIRAVAKWKHTLYKIGKYAIRFFFA
jgi:hypothetical protein